jgi:hypothetical protein
LRWYQQFLTKFSLSLANYTACHCCSNFQFPVNKKNWDTIHWFNAVMFWINRIYQQFVSLKIFPKILPKLHQVEWTAYETYILKKVIQWKILWNDGNDIKNFQQTKWTQLFLKKFRHPNRFVVFFFIRLFRRIVSTWPYPNVGGKK